MPHVDDLLGYASLAAAGLATAVVVSSVNPRDAAITPADTRATAIVRLQSVEVVVSRDAERARGKRDDVAARARARKAGA